MKIYQYLRVYIKIICRRFRIIILSTFWDIIRTREIWYVCLQTYRKNRICYKVAYFLRKIQTSRVNKSRILGCKNVKFSGYCFYMESSIQWNFQIWIIVPLMFSIFHKEATGVEFHGSSHETTLCFI